MTTRMITIEFDDAALSTCSAERLAMLWHVAQANPADGFDNDEPNDIAERVGREIIRRWLRQAPIELHRHQGRHYYWRQLTKFAKYEPGGGPGTPEWTAGRWVPRVDTDGDDAEGVREVTT